MSSEPAPQPAPSGRGSAREPGGARWLSAAVFGVLALGLVLVVRAAPAVAALALVGAILAYLLQPVVGALERRGLGRGAATWLVVLGLGVVLGLVAWLAVPALLAQAASLGRRWASGELPRLIADAEASIAGALPFVDAGALGLVDAVERATHPETGPLVVYVPGLLEAVGTAFLVPFVLFALLKDGPEIRKRLLSLVPNRAFEFAMNVAYKVDESLGGYLRSQATVAVAVGGATAIGLGLLGVDYYLVLGLLTGLANFVPYVGFVVSAALSVAVAVVTGGGVGDAVAVLALFGVLQFAENAMLQPWITGRTVSLHPALVLAAILVGGKAGGVLGMTVAVPLTAVLKVIVVETAVNLRRYHL